MKHRIDPKVDCVFKALLGTEENSNLLIHFLNSFLSAELISPITTVEIRNPYNDKEFLSDKLSVVDVKARDAQQRLYQIEIQMQNHPFLLKRIIYNWADIYSQQLQTGGKWDLLKPTYSLWLLNENLINDKRYCHRYKLRDDHGEVLVEQGGIWLLELAKFNIEAIKTNEQRWLQFFKNGESLDDVELPDWMNTTEMRQAMGTLSVFSEKEREYFKYQARQEYLRIQRTIQAESEKNKLEKDVAIQEKEAAIQEKEVAVQEKEVALQKALQADLEKQRALQEKENALLEVAQLKALLSSRS